MKKMINSSFNNHQKAPMSEVKGLAGEEGWRKVVPVFEQILLSEVA